MYESINKDTEEEERFSAHIEAFGHKMRAKVEAVSERESKLMHPIVYPRVGSAWLAQAKAQPVRVSSDNVCCEDPCRLAHRIGEADIDIRNKGKTRQGVPTQGVARRRQVSVQQGLSDQRLLSEQRGPAAAGGRAQVYGPSHAPPPTRGPAQAQNRAEPPLLR